MKKRRRREKNIMFNKPQYVHNQVIQDAIILTFSYSTHNVYDVYYDFCRHLYEDKQSVWHSVTLFYICELFLFGFKKRKNKNKNKNKKTKKQ